MKRETLILYYRKEIYLFKTTPGSFDLKLHSLCWPPGGGLLLWSLFILLTYNKIKIIHLIVMIEWHTWHIWGGMMNRCGLQQRFLTCSFWPPSGASRLSPCRPFDPLTFSGGWMRSNLSEVVFLTEKSKRSKVKTAPFFSPLQTCVFIPFEFLSEKRCSQSSTLLFLCSIVSPRSPKID